MILGISINYYKVEIKYKLLYILTVRIYNLNIQFYHFAFSFFFNGKNGINIDVYFLYSLYPGYFLDVINSVKAVDPMNKRFNNNAPKNE